MGIEVVAARRRDLLPAAVLERASDRRLIEQVHAGSERAFEVIFERHHRPVLAFCRHMLGSREEAEDAVQQTFLAAYRELVRAGPLDLRPWLYAIARHRCLSALRTRRERSLQEMPERGADHLIAELTTREDLRAILADVARLPDDQRAALVLAELGDISHEEIARLLGCPRQKVKALVFQARSSLTAGRAARETPCAEIQEQLGTLRGAALRRAVLRRHLDECPGCRAFREKARIQRRRLGLLPVAPIVGLKRAILGALFGSGGGGAGGAALTAGTLSGAGLAVTALVAVAIPAGAVPAAPTASRDGREAVQLVAPAKTTGHGAAPASASTRRVSAERAARERAREGWITSPRARDATQLRELAPRVNANDKHAAAPEQADGRDELERATSRDQSEPAKPRNSAKPSEPSKPNRRLRPVKPAKPLKPPQANSETTPSKQPKANGHVTPSKPPQANSQVAPDKPPQANGHATPAKPDSHAQTPPAAALDSAPAPGPSATPSPGDADAPGAVGKGSNGSDGHARPSG